MQNKVESIVVDAKPCGGRGIEPRTPKANSDYNRPYTVETMQGKVIIGSPEDTMQVVDRACGDRALQKLCQPATGWP